MARRLRELEMPAKRSSELEAEEDLDLESLGLEDEAPEMMEEEDLLDEEMESPLAEISDEELLAEVEARGLALEAPAEEEEYMDDMEMMDEEEMLPEEM